MNDNRHLVAASIVAATPPEKRREVSEPVLKGSLDICTYDTEDGHFKRNAHLEASAFPVVPNADGDFPVSALGLSRGDQLLLIEAQTAPKKWHFAPESALPGGETVLVLQSLAGSGPQTLATLRRSTGLDWWQPPQSAE